MARARNIKPSFFTNDYVSECSAFARLLFIGLWTVADREGRLENRPKKIKGELFPHDALEIAELLEELEKNKFIKRYEVNDNKYIQIINFTKHQKPHPNETESAIPSPDGSITKVESPSDQGDTRSGSSPLTPSYNSKPPLPPVAKEGVYKNGNGNGVFHIEPFLNDDAIMEARLKAPGWDIYALMRVYDEGIPTRGIPKHPAKAFPVWCGKYTKGNPP